MSRVTSTFAPPKPSAKADITTRDPAQYPSFSRALEQSYLQVLLTNTLGSTFYVEKKDIVAEAVEIVDRMIAQDKDFACKGMVYARNKGYMRSLPTMALAHLAVQKGADPLFEQTFPQVILTPNDLSDFTAIVKSLTGGEGGRKIKRVAGNWLRNLSEYWAIKYGSDQGDGYSIKDMLQVYHPAGTPLPLLAYLMGKEQAIDSLPQIQAFERLKVAKTDEDKVKAITEGRLPHEVATSFAGNSKEVWKAIVQQMPIFATLRNLATMERQGVLDACRERVEGVLTSPEAISKSKIFPFRFMDAIEKMQSAWAKDALRDAIDLSFTNIPDIEGRTAVAVDRSGSMSSYIGTASLFGICLMRKAKRNGRFMLFDNMLEELAVSMRDSIITQAQRIKARGGTDTELPIRKLLTDRDKCDNIILITDEQQNMGDAFVNVLALYRQQVNHNAKCFIIDVAPYNTALVGKDPLTWFIYGWSDNVLNFISQCSQGWGSMADYIRGESK